MSGFFQRTWRWLACENNRGRVIVIATVAGVLIAAITFVAHLQTPASEVRMSVPDFQDALERRAKEVRNDLATAHGEERIRLENERAEITRQLSDVQAAYAKRQERIGELEASLARLSTDFDDDGLAGARTALEAGDFSKADALLAAIEGRADVAVARAAEVAFRRGQIAATRISWGEAAAHFDKAARLDPVYDHLNQAGIYAWRAGRYATALRHLEGLLALSRREHGEGSPETAAALNSLANLLGAMGRFEEAERLYRQALEIGRETLGEGHPDYATRLSNLATLLAATGRYDEAEPLFRQALEIDRKTLGERHPLYATRLNNLASLLKDTGRHEEAESFYRQALEISRDTLDEGHPDYATRLNNLAGLLAATGRYEEAEPLYQQALEILRVALGDNHANTRRTARNYARLLQARFPSSPALSELRAAFGENVGRP